MVNLIEASPVFEKVVNSFAVEPRLTNGLRSTTFVRDAGFPQHLQFEDAADRPRGNAVTGSKTATATATATAAETMRDAVVKRPVPIKR